MADPKRRHITSKAMPAPPAAPSSAATLMRPASKPPSARVGTDPGLGHVEDSLENTQRDPFFDEEVSGEMLPSDFLNTDEGWDDAAAPPQARTEPPPRPHRHETDRSFPAPPPDPAPLRASSPESDPPTAVKPNEPPSPGRAGLPSAVPDESEESDDELVNTLVNSPGPDDVPAPRPAVDPRGPTMRARVSEIPQLLQASQAQPAVPAQPAPGFSPPEPSPSHVVTQETPPEMTPGSAPDLAAAPAASAPVAMPAAALATGPLPNLNPSAAAAPAVPQTSPPVETQGYVPRMQMPQASGPSVKMVMAAGAGVGLLGAIALVAYLSTRGPDGAAETAATETAAPTPTAATAGTAVPDAPPAEPTGGAEATPPKDAPAATGAEAEARAALEKLRAGMPHCVKDVIHVLPGPSPAVPQLFATLKGGPYPSNWKDWDNPTWHCTETKLKEPQRFQIQWQVDVPSREGVGLAWVDEDGDGEPDVELFFEAKLLERDVVEVGEIGRREVTRKPVHVRR